MLQRVLRVGLLLGSAWLAGCDPCDQLATKICDCEVGDIAKQSCQQRVAVQKEQRKPGDVDRKACEAALKTCSCDAVKQLDLAACGFSR